MLPGAPTLGPNGGQSVSGRLLLVTGASSDIGVELIRQLDSPALRIIAHSSRSGERVRDLAAGLASNVVPVRADLRNAGELSDMIAAIKAVGVPDQIVHLPAPPFTMERFGKRPWEDFEAELEIGLRSIVSLLHSFLPAMVERRSGQVVFVLSSVTMGIPPKGTASYTTGKYALLGLMKSLASEYSESGIRFNAVSPSMVDSRFLTKLPARLVELAAEGHPQRRHAECREVASVIRFLLSGDATYVSGANIPITGGSVG